VDVLKLLNTHAPLAIVFKGKSYATVLRTAQMVVTKENPVVTKTLDSTILRNAAATNRPNSHVPMEISVSKMINNVTESQIVLTSRMRENNAALEDIVSTILSNVVVTLSLNGPVLTVTASKKISSAMDNSTAAMDLITRIAFVVSKALSYMMPKNVAVKRVNGNVNLVINALPTHNDAMALKIVMMVLMRD
jgi:hypothetical protein